MSAMVLLQGDGSCRANSMTGTCTTDGQRPFQRPGHYLFGLLLVAMFGQSVMAETNQAEIHHGSLPKMSLPADTLPAHTGANDATDAGREALPTTQATETPYQYSWRRTVDGWETRESWKLEPQPITVSHLVAAIHPALVGMLALLLSMAALIGFDKSAENASRG